MIKNLKSKRSIKIKSYFVSSLLTLTLAALLIPAGAGFAQVAQPTMIAAGISHSLVLKSDGTVWAFGYNASGQLGDGTNTNRSTPVQVSGLTGVAAISTEGVHSLALKSDGTVWAWGSNLYGQLGDGTTTNRNTPVQVSGLTGVIAIAAGGIHSLALKSDGTVWAWGFGGIGQIGNGTNTNYLIPVQVSGLAGVTAIASGKYNSFAIKSDGTAWAWGYNVLGQLGDGTATNRNAPVQMSGLTGVTALSAGIGKTLALKSDGTVWTTNPFSPYIPTPVTALFGVFVTISVGIDYDHSFAIKSDGTVWAWGSNLYGQLGDGTTTDRNTPVQVSGLTGVIAVSAGNSHSLAIKSDNTVWAWGSGFGGALGNGSTADINQRFPIQVSFAVIDITPPSAPSSLTANAISSTQINLSWTASTDNVGVVGYNVERCQGVGCSSFVEIAALGNVTTFSNTGLTPSTSYSYRVRARDAVPNFSGYSNTASAVTPAPPDTTPPDTTINTAIDGNSSPVSNGGSTNSTSITFAFSGTDNVAVTSFECSLDGVAFTTCATPKNYTGLALGGHNFQVRAKDAANNVDLTPASHSWTVIADADGDTISDSTDNCINTPNTNQLNTDNDGSQVATPITDLEKEVGGDSCDVDDDNDKLWDTGISGATVLSANSVDTQPLIFSRCADDMTGIFPGTYVSCSGQTSGTSGGTTFAETQTAPFGNIRIKDALNALQGLNLTGLAASVKVKICSSQFLITLNAGQIVTNTCASLTAVADVGNIGDISIKVGPPLTPNATPAVNVRLFSGQEVKLVDQVGDPAIITPITNTQNIETEVLAEPGTGNTDTDKPKLYSFTQAPDSEVHVVQNPDGSTTVSVVRGSATVMAANSTTVQLSAGQSVRIDKFGNIHGQTQEARACPALEQARVRAPQDQGLNNAITNNCTQ